MGKSLLNQSEIRFIRSSQQWNRKFETLFAALFIFTIIFPAILTIKMDIPGLRDAMFHEGIYYSFAVSLGCLITFLNERWIRLMDKLIKLD